VGEGGGEGVGGGREGEGGKGGEGRGGGGREGGVPAASAGLDATSELQLQASEYARALDILTVAEALKLGFEIAAQCCVGLGCAFDAFRCWRG
jgi:hypothetical protein